MFSFGSAFFFFPAVFFFSLVLFSPACQRQRLNSSITASVPRAITRTAAPASSHPGDRWRPFRKYTTPSISTSPRIIPRPHKRLPFFAQRMPTVSSSFSAKKDCSASLRRRCSFDSSASLISSFAPGRCNGRSSADSTRGFSSRYTSAYAVISGLVPDSLKRRSKASLSNVSSTASRYNPYPRCIASWFR